MPEIKDVASLFTAGRSLSPNEIIHMSRGNFVIMKAGIHPIQTKLHISTGVNPVAIIVYITSEKIRPQTEYSNISFLPHIRLRDRRGMAIEERIDSLYFT